MYETIIFDLDGTLLDTLDDLWTATNVALEKHSLPPRGREEVRAFVGNGVAKLIERAAGEAPRETVLGAIESFRAYYGAHCEDKTKPYEGILPLLQELNRRGVRTAVVSNKPDFAVKKLAESYFGGLLLAAVGENESAGIRKKPAPDSLLAVMKELGAKRERTAYVGDSEVDIQTAQNAGVDCISVTWGFKDKQFLLENGGTVLVDTPMEVLECFPKSK